MSILEKCTYASNEYHCATHDAHGVVAVTEKKIREYPLKRLRALLMSSERGACDMATY